MLASPSHPGIKPVSQKRASPPSPERCWLAPQASQPPDAAGHHPPAPRGRDQHPWHSGRRRGWQRCSKDNLRGDPKATARRRPAAGGCGGTAALWCGHGCPHAAEGSRTRWPWPALLTTLPSSRWPKLQAEFSLSLQTDSGSRKSYFSPKLVFTRIFSSFFADNYYSIRNRRNQCCSSVKARAVRGISKRPAGQVSKGRLRRTSCATSGMRQHLFLGFLLLLSAKWLTGRIQLVQLRSGTRDCTPSFPACTRHQLSSSPPFQQSTCMRFCFTSILKKMFC